MTYRALVVDDDSNIIEVVSDIVESLGHKYDAAQSQEEARKLLDKNRYSYILLDLEIPVRTGRGLPRIQNGQNMLAEIVELFGKQVPVIIMTGHGTNTPVLAVEMMKAGAIDYVTKPFPTTGKTLDQAILEAIEASGRQPRKQRFTSRRTRAQVEPTPFEGGELIFHSNRVEICGVDILVSGLTRKTLDALKDKRDSGKYVAYSGEDLAKLTKSRRGQNGISEVVRDFRNKSIELLRDEANIVCERQDIIQSGGPGYRFNKWITIREASGTKVGTDRGTNVTNRGTKVGTNVTKPNERQRWILDQLEKGVKVQIGTVTSHFNCSVRTAKRDLAQLKEWGRIEFVGPPRTGHYQLRKQPIRA